MKIFLKRLATPIKSGMKICRCSIGILLFLSSPVMAVNSQYCSLLMSQIPSIFQTLGEGDLIVDRERIGDIALQCNIAYLQFKIPISQMTTLMASRNIPKELIENEDDGKVQLFDPITPAAFGADIGIALGGLNIVLDPASIIVEGDTQSGREIGPNPNHNALVLLSPRVLSLSAWSYGYSLAIEDLENETDGHNLLTSSNSHELIQRQLGYIYEDQKAEGLGRWKFRFHQPIPTYEVMAIVIQPENRHYAERLLAQAPGLTDWRRRVIFSDSYPVLYPLGHSYLPSEKPLVLRRLNPAF